MDVAPEHLPCTRASLNKPTQGKKELTEKFCFLYHSFNVVRSLCESFVQQCFCLFLRDWVLQADCGQQGEGLCVCPQGFVHVVCHHHGFTDAVGCQVTLDETWWGRMETLQGLSQHHRHSALHCYLHLVALRCWTADTPISKYKLQLRKGICACQHTHSTDNWLDVY